MKKVLVFCLCIITCLCFVGCESGSKANDGISYSTDYGTKIQTLPIAKQATISKYVDDCKAIFVNEYNQRVDGYITLPFLDFTDAFVFDFSKINEAALSEDSASLWQSIKSLHGDAAPVMYIELNGYCSFYADWIALTVNSVGVSNGFFVFSDNTVMPLAIIRIISLIGAFELPEGTETINCGNKFAQKLSAEKLASYDTQLKYLTNIAQTE